MRTSVVLALVLLCSCSDEGVTLPPIEQQPMIDAGADMMDQAQDAARDADAIPDLTQDMPVDVDMRQPADMVDMPDEAPDMCASCEGKQVCELGACEDATSWVTWKRTWVSPVDEQLRTLEFAVSPSNGPAIFDDQRNTISIVMGPDQAKDPRDPKFELTLRRASELDFALESCPQPNDDVELTLVVDDNTLGDYWQNVEFGVEDCLPQASMTVDHVNVWDLRIESILRDRIKGTFKANILAQEGARAGEVIDVEGHIDMPLVHMP